MTATTSGVMKHPLILGLLLATAGCLDRAGIAADEAVAILKRSDQCRIVGPTFRPLRDMAELRRVVAGDTGLAFGF